jgi:hypothetical protein
MSIGQDPLAAMLLSFIHVLSPPRVGETRGGGPVGILRRESLSAWTTIRLTNPGSPFCAAVDRRQ